MKKLISLLLTATMMFSTSVIAEDNNVEIKFSVGDEMLYINGAEVQVEKPYVVGEGVTLVPLRVITEAFGATVEWIEDTKSINLTYPDVKITLQIDNPVAEVNGMAEQLLSAPELTSNGFTMVPLRFISETFGAEVSYDDATRAITVVKSNADDIGKIVQGAVEEEFIGDSSFGWMMENPDNMNMDYRAFDGTATSFVYDDNNMIGIEIGKTDEKFDFDRFFVETKNSMQNMTLVTADKDVTTYSDCKIMHFRTKDNEYFIDIWYYIKGDVVYYVRGLFENSDSDISSEGLRILSTFKPVFESEGTYDLTNAVNGYRKYEMKKLGFSVEIPEDLWMQSETVNEAFFVGTSDNNRERVSIGIYSKSSAGSAKSLAEKDYDHNKKVINEEKAKFSNGVTTRTYNDINAFEYTADIMYDGEEGCRKRDVFFEKGEYVYNVSVEVPIPNLTADNEINYIMNSISAEEINADEAGILMRNVLSDEEGTYKVDTDKWSIEIPNTFSKIGNEEEGYVFLDETTGIGLYFNGGKYISKLTFSMVTDMMEEVEKTYAQSGGTAVLKVQADYFGKMKYANLIYKFEKSGQTYYVHDFAARENNDIYTFSVEYPEMAYSKYNIKQISDIISSLTMK